METELSVWKLYGMGKEGMGNVRYGKCPRWEMSWMGIVRGKSYRMGIVRSGNCPGWEMSGMELSWWEMSGMGIVRDGKCPDGGKCPGWELSGMGIVREPVALKARSAFIEDVILYMWPFKK